MWRRTSAARIACARNNFYAQKILTDENFNEKRVNAAATSDTFAGA
jgi:hypothetical protein